jgi:hypothetical protein
MTDLANIDQQIAGHADAIADLRDQALGSPEFRKLTGHAALKWLKARGATDEQARDAIVAILKANHAAANQDAEE